MHIEIDIPQSIKNKRLKVIHQDFWQIVGASLFVILASAIILLGLFILFELFSEEKKPLIVFIIFAPFLFLGITALHALLFDNRLINMKGEAFEKNYCTIRSILQNRYHVTIAPSSTPILSMYKESTFWKFGVRVIVIFHEEEVYMNISRFNQKGLKSIFHLWLDNLKIRSINREFQQQLGAN